VQSLINQETTKIMGEVKQEATAMNKIKLESKVIDFIQRYSLVSPEEIVVVGVSGGADSVCLLHVLAK